MGVRSEGGGGRLEAGGRIENTAKWSGDERGRREGKETGGRGAVKEEPSM